jgi:molybdate transport system substrate-binding protein
MKRIAVALALACGAPALTACGGPSAAARGALLVGAASDLAAAMPALIAAFETETGIRSQVTLGSSGQLAHQILYGAPIDAFVSADRGWIALLDEAGRLDPGSERLYAYGRLVLLARGDALPPRDLSALRDASMRRIAMANPEHAPYGAAAREALTSVGLWEELQPRLVIAENVRQAQQFVETGSVDVALTAWSLVDSQATNWTLVPEALHTPLAQTAAAVAGRDRVAQAREFVRFMAGPAAAEILGRYNFVLPPRAAVQQP